MASGFKVDENLPVEVTLLLREAGYDALSVHDQDLVGRPDKDILVVCREENRALITLDLDFADIRQYPPKSQAGLIVLRLRHQDKLHVLNVCRQIARTLAQEDVTGCLWIVDENQIKVRE